MNTIQMNTVQRQAKIKMLIGKIDVDVAAGQKTLRELENSLKDEQKFAFMDSVFGINTKENTLKRIEELKEEIAFDLEARQEFLQELEFEEKHGAFEDGEF